jgi:hypothetical protein
MGNISFSQLCVANYEKNEDIVTPSKDEMMEGPVKAVRAIPKYNESEWERLRSTIVVRNYFRHLKLEPLLSLVSSKIS